MVVAFGEYATVAEDPEASSFVIAQDLGTLLVGGFTTYKSGWDAIIDKGLCQMPGMLDSYPKAEALPSGAMHEVGFDNLLIAFWGIDQARKFLYLVITCLDV